MSKNKRFTLRIDETDEENLEELANFLQRSRSDAVRHIINLFLNQYIKDTSEVKTEFKFFESSRKEQK